jgi:hypothetical protein
VADVSEMLTAFNIGLYRIPEKSVNFYENARRNIPEGRHLRHVIFYENVSFLTKWLI